jgi:universal stress protein A
MSEQEYKHLLLAVGFSPDSEPVIERALRLRALSGARLSLLHVLEYVPAGVELMPMTYAADTMMTDEFDLENRLFEAAKGHLDQLGERLGVSVEDRHLRVGATAQGIQAVAGELGVDLVILGSHGRHGLMALLGSTAKTVVQGLPCDLLCVRIPEQT